MIVIRDRTGAYLIIGQATARDANNYTYRARQLRLRRGFRAANVLLSFLVPNLSLSTLLKTGRYFFQPR